jgi:hypothetical protein
MREPKLLATAKTGARSAKCSYSQRCIRNRRYATSTVVVILRTKTQLPEA